MRIVIRSRGLCVDANMRAYLNQEVHRVMGTLQRRVSSVHVYFTALKGPDDGLGCRMVVNLTRTGRKVIVTETCPTYNSLADRVVRRAANAVRRRLQRKYARRRRGLLVAGDSSTL